MKQERECVPAAQAPYCVDTLGAPFKVVLHNGVTFGINEQTGEQTVCIQDTVGLINAVVRSRVLHTRKLSGEEIRFIRKAVGVKAKALAEFLDLTPEHFSRCESGVKALSAPSEKHFRMAAYLASFLKDPSAFFELSEPVTPAKPSKKAVKDATQLFRWFQSLKIETVFDPSEELRFEFSRRCHNGEKSCGNDNEGDWLGDDCIAA
ncbi:MAG: hypothetical protein ACR652_14990 [Methylocystis sp.]|uniref:hypothetical protein n=1 Tax=Methylocystis sp. TaxID=1911079 RepID=UPI003DA5A108